MNGEAGKGDRYRPIDMKKYRENYEKIFGKKSSSKKDISKKTKVKK